MGRFYSTLMTELGQQQRDSFAQCQREDGKGEAFVDEIGLFLDTNPEETKCVFFLLL